ncbi:Polysaccharide biosynthesis protein [uncultured archaeon]|nr:Polysaccharide biosynthesis protein [uncultured archaeon]
MLDPNGYGIYTLAMGVALFFGSLCSMSFGTYLNKRMPLLLAQKKTKQIREALGDSFFLTLMTSGAAVLIGIAFSAAISGYVFHGAGYSGLINFALMSVVTLALFNLVYSALIGTGEGRWSSMAHILYNITYAAISILLVYAGYGPMGALAGMVIGPLAGTIIGTAFIAKRFGFSLKLNGMWKRARDMVSFSVPVSAAGIVSGLVSNFSIMLLGVFSVSAIVGSYGVASRIGSLISIELGFIGSVLVQMFASAIAKRKNTDVLKKLYNYSVYFGILITAPIVAYLMVLPTALVSSVFPSYIDSVFYIPAIAIGILAGIIGSYASSLVISVGDVRTFLKYSVVASAASLAATVALVPYIGAYGVIIGMVFVGSLTADVLYIRYAKDRLHIRTEYGKIARILLAGVTLAAIMLPINLIPVRATFQLIIGMAAVVLMYPPLLVKTGALGKSELSLLKRVGGRVQTFGKIVGLAVGYASMFL